MLFDWTVDWMHLLVKCSLWHFATTLVVCFCRTCAVEALKTVEIWIDVGTIMLSQSICSCHIWLLLMNVEL